MSENIKFTREDGTDCFSGTIKYEVGKVITAPDWDPEPRCGGGLHFGEARVSICATLVAPGRSFKVEPIGQVVEISEGKKKAQSLRIVEELDFSKLLLMLAKDESMDARLAVAENPNTSEQILSEFTEDRSWSVRWAVARNPHTNGQALSELAKNKSWAIREVVAKNPNTTKETLSELASDEDRYVRETALQNLKN